MTSGDHDRFEQLAATHGPRVLAYLLRRTDEPADAADVFQEVLVTTWRRLNRVPPEDALALAWMVAVARRALANHRRGVLRRLSATQRLRDAIAAAPHRATSDVGLPDAMSVLSADDRELLTLVYWDGFTVEEVAAALSLSSSTARKRLQRARDRVRQQIGEDSPLSASGTADRRCIAGAR